MADTAGDLMIRPATEADLPAVLALYAQPDFDGDQVLPLAEAKALLARFATYPDYTLYVAEMDDEIVGTFALLVMDNLGHCGTPSAIVEDVIVAGDRQGRGIGRAMMKEAAARAVAKGAYKLALTSNIKREGAHAFYEALGFERHGVSFRVGLERSLA